MFEEDLRAKITGDAGVKALVKKAAQVAWGDRPQASALPGVTLEIVFDQRPQHMQGFQDTRGTQVQADCWSLDRQQARDIREALIAAVVPGGTSGSTRFSRSFVDRSASTFEQLDDKTIIYRERIDFTVWHAAAA
jgi:hypothetical protein